MIWIAISLLTAVAALAILWPLSRSPGTANDPAEMHRDFYLAQLAELERDRSRGLLGPSEAEGAKAEIARRLIASQDEDTASARESLTARRLAAAIAIILVPALALGMYGLLGQPALPDRPLQARLNAPPGKIELVAAVAKIEKHLKNKPNDGNGWEVIAPVYKRMGRHADAAIAWQNAIKYLGPSPARLSARGEALVFAARGQVTPEARKAFDAALRLDPSFAQALFFSGVAAEQSGDNVRAIAVWRRLVGTAPKDAPWSKSIEARIAALEAKRIGNAPSSEAGKAIAAMPAESRAEAIRSMVSGLAEKLKADEKDLPGWLMLMRAHIVLKEPEKARAAVAKARQIFAADKDALSKINAQVNELGIGAGQ